MNKFRSVLAIAALLGVMGAFQAAAAVTSINLEAALPEEISTDDDNGGQLIEPHLQAAGGNLDVSSSTENQISSPKSMVVYDVSVYSYSSERFANDPAVTVRGGAEIDRIRVYNDTYDSYVTMRVKAYPYYQLKKPSNIQIHRDTGKISWDGDEYAGRYEYVVFYLNQNGDERHTSKKTTTKTSVDVGSVIENRDYTDIAVAVRAIAENTSGSRTYNMADSAVACTDENAYDYLSYFGDYDVWRDVGTKVYTRRPDGSTSSSGSTVLGGGGSSQYWSNQGNSWQYYVNGTPLKNTWSQINGHWYYFNGSGFMTTGWQFVNGYWYFLTDDPNSATYGAMLTGWQWIDGNHDGRYESYCLNAGNSNRLPYGAMYANGVTPDNYQVNASGAWVQNGVVKQKNSAGQMIR